MKDRIPAQVLEIEESVLAGCLLFPEMRDEALELLQPSDFYKPDHRTIFEAVIELTRRKEPVDLLTVRAALDGKIDSIALKLAEITTQPVPSDMSCYCQKIVNCRQLRESQAALCKSYDRCFDTATDFSELSENIRHNLDAIAEGALTKDSEFLSIQQLTEQSAERYAKAKDGDSLPGLQTGFPTLDRITGGLHPGLIIIAARPSVGKTAFASNLFCNMARRGIRCGFFSLEMSAAEIDDRINSAESGVNGGVLRTGRKLDEATWDKLISAFEKKSKWQAFIDERPATITELTRRARQMRRAGTEIILIDQLSHIRPDRGMRGKTSWEINTHHVEELARLKKELQIPVVLLCQLNREIEKRSDSKPVLSDLKNTGALEEAADMVLLGFKHDETHRQWDVAKHRNGPTWAIPMQWDAGRCRFYETAQGENIR